MPNYPYIMDYMEKHKSSQPFPADIKRGFKVGTVLKIGLAGAKISRACMPSTDWQQGVQFLWFSCMNISNGIDVDA